MKMSDVEKDTVLVVDDQPEDIQVLILALQECGLTILVARQGEHAIDLAAQFTPDVILLDVRIPGMEGFETCRRLKANAATRNIPVIFMTALGNTEDIVRGFEVGGVDYIIKPIRVEEVLARHPAKEGQVAVHHAPHRPGCGRDRHVRRGPPHGHRHAGPPGESGRLDLHQCAQAVCRRPWGFLVFCFRYERKPLTACRRQAS